MSAVAPIDALDRRTAARIESLDIVKAIAIILVVVGHLRWPEAYHESLQDFIYVFHVPLLFILAGYFFGATDKRAPFLGVAILGSRTT